MFLGLKWQNIKVHICKSKGIKCRFLKIIHCPNNSVTSEKCIKLILVYYLLGNYYCYYCIYLFSVYIVYIVSLYQCITMVYENKDCIDKGNFVIVIFFPGSSWLWSYCSWIYNYLYNQCLPPLMLWVRTLFITTCTTLCDKVCKWLPPYNWNIVESGAKHHKPNL
jgi:hypothetical protein